MDCPGQGKISKSFGDEMAGRVSYAREDGEKTLDHLHIAQYVVDLEGQEEGLFRDLWGKACYRPLTVGSGRRSWTGMTILSGLCLYRTLLSGRCASETPHPINSF